MNASVSLADDRFLQSSDAAGFPNSGFAGKRDDLAFTNSRQAPAFKYQPHFVSAAYQWQLGASADGCKPACCRSFSDHAPGRHRFGKTLYLVRSNSLELEQVAEKTLCGL